VNGGDGAEDQPGGVEQRCARMLRPQALLALQLLACGYAPGQIALLTSLPHADVVAALNEAAGTLGASTWRGAVAAARRRALIV
jgi:hypothetical protein